VINSVAPTSANSSPSGRRLKKAATGEPATRKSHAAVNPDSTGILMAQMSRKARVFVVEDHPFVRESVVRLINRQGDLVCCGEADNIVSSPAVVATLKPDLVLLDLRLKDGDGFQLMELLKVEFPEMPVVVLSQFGEELYVERALRAGAKGFVMKQEAAAEVLDAIRAVLAGKISISREMAERLPAALLQSQLEIRETRPRGNA
jgi:DNA-binding NarL/FixJ family response regulator